jgi:hypothetical protein
LLLRRQAIAGLAGGLEAAEASSAAAVFATWRSGRACGEEDSEVVVCGEVLVVSEGSSRWW